MTERPLPMKDLRFIASMKLQREMKTVRPMLEDLVRAAYPHLKEKCLCSQCLLLELQRGAGRVTC